MSVLALNDTHCALEAALTGRRAASDASLTVRGFERIHPAEIPEVLRTLKAHAPLSLTVQVDCVPAAAANAGYLTIRPPSLWSRLVELAGFEVVGRRAVPSAATVIEGAWSARAHWARFNPFREHDPTAEWLFELRHSPGGIDPAAEESMHRILGNRRRTSVPAALLGASTHLFFLVGTYQEFRQYQPIWSQLPASAFTVLLRIAQPEPTWPRREQCIEAWCATRGMRVVRVGSTTDVEWREWRNHRCALVAGADSTAFASHILNAAFIDHARREGWHTVQLQHGIWPYASLRQPMTMLSDVVLTWSPEFKQSLDAIVEWADGSRRARGATDGIRFVTAGCPVFDRYADADASSLADLLGSWVSQYRRTILVATNLHWSAHEDGERANAAILEAAASMPDILFIVKPHPVHDPDEAFLSACPTNVQVLDEFCCLFADLDSARLVRATDAVVSTLSTVALEAALADRPVLILDTRNANKYEHMRETAPEDLDARLAAMFTHPDDTRAFREHYFAGEMLGGGTAAVLEHIAAELERPARVAAPRDEALVAFAEAASAQSAEIAALQRQLEVERAQLAAERGRLQFDREQLQARHDALQVLADVHQRNWVRSRPGERWQVALFGASSLGRSAVAHLHSHPNVDVRWFFDNDPQKWGQSLDSIPIVEPSAGAYAAADAVVVTSVHARAIIRQVIDAGFSHKLILNVSVFDALRR